MLPDSNFTQTSSARVNRHASAILVALLPLTVIDVQVLPGVSLHAAGTVVALSLTAIAVVISMRFFRSALREGLALASAASAMIALMAVAPPSLYGMQNVSVLTLFVLSLMAASLPSRTAELRLRVFDSCFTWACTFLAGGFLVQVGLGVGPYGTGMAHARDLALALTLAVAWNLSGAGRQSRWFVVLFIAAILLSLSRTAVAVVAATGLIIWSLRVDESKRILRLVGATLAAGLIIWVTVNTDNPLRDRFVTGDVSLDIFGLRLNAMGRTAMWEATLESASRAPLLGHGAGSAGALMQSTVHPAIAHPHNDYLRLYHDFGLIVGGIWVLGMLGILARRLRSVWRGATANSGLDLAGFGAVVVVLLCMVTDNVIVYAFVMAPAGYIIGLRHSQGALSAAGSSNLGGRPTCNTYAIESERGQQRPVPS
jgi:O-antigen ligase